MINDYPSVASYNATDQYTAELQITTSSGPHREAIGCLLGLRNDIAIAFAFDGCSGL